MKYILVKEPEEKFEEIVNAKIAQQFMPYGPPMVIQVPVEKGIDNPKTEIFIYQAMIVK